MSTCVSMSELQGIGSILGTSEYERSKTAASLRRTLSADMSSKKWLAKHGFSPLKRISSSEEFQIANDADSFRSSQFVKKKEEPPGQSDIWNSIVSQKQSSSSTLIPYIHPLTKRSRSLSQQSLEICTESLGSETGSDGFSSYPSSETSDEEQEEEQEQQQEQAEEKETLVVDKQELGVVNFNCYAIKKSHPPRSFPPPLPSLSQSGLHMRSHRIDGRLVLEAVPAPVPSHNYFQAQREGGRLLLTFTNPKSKEITNNIDKKEAKIEEDSKLKIKTQKDEEENVFEDEEKDEEFEEDDVDEEEEEEEEDDQVMERSIVLEIKISPPKNKVPTGVINVHRSALMVNKLMGLTNRDPTWSPKLEKIVDIGDEQTPLTQSLPPPPPRVTRLVPSFNTYDYCWRSKSAAATVCTHPLTQQPPPMTKNKNYSSTLLFSKNLNSQEQQELVLLRGNKADYLVPLVRGCKEPRRSLLIWEPYCIASS